MRLASVSADLTAFAGILNPFALVSLRSPEHRLCDSWMAGAGTWLQGRRTFACRPWLARPGKGKGVGSQVLQRAVEEVMARW